MIFKNVFICPFLHLSFGIFFHCASPFICRCHLKEDQTFACSNRSAFSLQSPLVSLHMGLSAIPYLPSCLCLFLFCQTFLWTQSFIWDHWTFVFNILHQRGQQGLPLLSTEASQLVLLQVTDFKLKLFNNICKANFKALLSWSVLLW